MLYFLKKNNVHLPAVGKNSVHVRLPSFHVYLFTRREKIPLIYVLHFVQP